MHTTDLATLVQREEDYQPDEVIYVVDKRQELHFTQVFRCAKKTGIVSPNTRSGISRIRYDERERRKTVQNP